MKVKKEYTDDGLFALMNDWPGLKRITAVVAFLLLATVVGEAGMCRAESFNKKINKLNTGSETILNDLLDDIFQQTGYTIVVSEQLSSVPVVGVYRDITVDDFLRRVLKKQNVSVLYDKKKKQVLVRGFGESIRLGKDGGSYSVSGQGGVSEGSAAPSEAVDPLSGIPVAELQEKQARQMEELRRRENDPDAVDPLSGMSLAELQAKQARQMEELKGRENDPDAIDVLGDIPVVELREKKSRQLEQLKKQQTDPEAIEPQSGLPYMQLNAKKARQLEQLKAREKDPGAVDPLSGIPLIELQEKQSRQLEQLRRQQNTSD